MQLQTFTEVRLGTMLADDLTRCQVCDFSMSILPCQQYTGSGGPPGAVYGCRSGNSFGLEAVWMSAQLSFLLVSLTQPEYGHDPAELLTSQCVDSFSLENLSLCLFPEVSDTATDV